MAVVGIDLGTTMCAVAYVDEHGRPTVLRNDDGEMITPSVVFFESSDNHVVGVHARREIGVNPELVVETVKHFMGHDTEYEFHGEEFKPETISAIILRKLIRDAEGELGERVTGAVITVPAIFGDKERNATRAAAEIAGIRVIGLLDEPQAAAIAYAKDAPDQTFLVYDLGGGTFDITVMRKEGDRFVTLRTDGDRRLGGKDWDQEIAMHMAATFKAEHGEDPMRDPATRFKLLAAAEEVKKALTRKETTRFAVTHRGKETVGQMTRSDFERITKPLLDQTEATTRQVVEDLQQAGALPAGWRSIDRVLLVGGSSRMPMVTAMMERISDQRPEILDVDVVVAQGAALFAANRELHGGSRPGEASSVPDVRLSAVAQQRIASIDIERVCSFGIGTDVQDEDTGQLYHDVLIEKNTPLPATAEQVYGTVVPGQKRVQISIFEGEGRDLSKCLPLGHGILELPPNLPKGSPILVGLGLDDESCIIVFGRDLTSGHEIHFVLEREGALDANEIAREATRLSRSRLS